MLAGTATLVACATPSTNKRKPLTSAGFGFQQPAKNVPHKSAADWQGNCQSKGDRLGCRTRAGCSDLSRFCPAAAAQPPDDFSAEGTTLPCRQPARRVAFSWSWVWATGAFLPHPEGQTGHPARISTVDFRNVWALNRAARFPTQRVLPSPCALGTNETCQERR